MLITKAAFTKLHCVLLLLFLFRQTALCQGKNDGAVINFVYSSDAHYGISRADFRGDTNVAAYKVNAAMIRQMNTLPELTLPNGELVKAVDYLVQTGDVANRMEYPIQSAAQSWKQFEHDYVQSITLKGHDGKPAKLLCVPGNHDISNAIGYPKPLKPLTDPTIMVNMYNQMVKPKKALTNQTYNYQTDKVNYSLNIKGVHLMFITLWPDSAERIWMQKDLDTVARNTPVIIFTHDQPTCEAKHFTNPVPPYQMKPGNKFENLTAEHYKEGVTAAADGGSTEIEQRGWVKFLKLHPNIMAYFHGNSNWNEFYVYHGPDNDVKLNVFRVDSPMKGKYSAKDETKLSFQLISLNTNKQTLTVSECLWNTEPQNPSQKVIIGQTATVSIKVP
ncbi:metallophosphoesterase family protein [Mucilaginibacter paludis]|uniref:Calcineurin-like phosphoesterase domain-containing protein n=1 Tax=Mucilaginibacter paludis DSM 18603 TaxID=714943 RepID=H1YB61_9SPHI|nr:metallophosphoesterase [Mucilaginibacter paludis]EHQ30587.1 hypothetical protein Mucpa_6534 [Mucilaginibacter paludis DSM 18603]